MSLHVVHTKTPLSNTFWLVGERAARVGVTATVFALVARHLQPAGFGQLNVAIASTAIAAALATLGLEGLVVSQLVRRPEARGVVLGTALRLRVAASVLTLLGLLGTAWIIPEWKDARGIIMLAGLGLLFSPADVVDLCFQRYLDARRTVLARLGTVMAGAGLRLALIAADQGVPAFAAAQAGEALLLAAALWWSYRRSPYAGVHWGWDPDLARYFLQRGVPLALSGMLVAMSLRLDQLLVRGWLGAPAAGVYFASAKLIEVALLAGSSLTLSLFPALAGSHHQSAPDFHVRLQAMFDAMSAVGWVIVIGCTLLGPWLIPWLYGDSYRAAVPVLLWQAWGALIALNAGARWQYILLAAPTWLNLLAALASIVCQLCLAPWLLPRWGVAGAAASWTLSLATSGLLTTFLFRPLRPCALAQMRGLLIPFAPGRWRVLLAQFTP